MTEIIQWALAGLVISGYIVIWRMDSSSRATRRIQQAARRNVAEQKRAIASLKQYAADWGQLNQARAATNARYAEVIEKIRDKFGIEA